MRVSIFSISLLLFFAMPSLASILIAAPQSSDTEFDAFSHLHPELVPFADFEAENLPSPQEKQKILQQFIRGKERYFAGDTRAAKTIFSDIMDSSTEEPWLSDMRSLFFDSALYLATLEVKKDVRSQHIRTALKWKPARILWSAWTPELKNEFELQSAQPVSATKLVFWNLHLRRAFIDGESVDPRNEINVQLPEGKNSFVFLDNQHVPLHVQIRAAHQSDLHAPDVFLISGTCQQPGIRSEYQSLAVTVFFAKDCVWDRSIEGEWHRWNESQPTPTRLLSSGYFNTRTAWPAAPPPQEHFYQKPLFWAAVVGVLAIAVKIQADQNNRGTNVTRVAQP